MKKASVLAVFIAFGCKETPVGPGPSSDSGQPGGVVAWQGTQSSQQGGPGNAARIEFEQSNGELKGMLYVAYGADAADLGPVGFLSGPAQGGAFVRASGFLPDGGARTKYPMTVTFTSANHMEVVEQIPDIDSGTMSVYYRMDRQ
jgi:hypothetical protein